MKTYRYRPLVGLFIALVSLFIMFFGASIIHAQAPVVPVELTGAIEAMDATSITISGQLIDISTAEINVTLAVGLIVKAEGTVENGQFVARQVNAVDTTTPLTNSIEIVGTLSALDGSNATVAGMTFDISAAEMGAGVVVGEIVKVHASFANGVWSANEIQLQPASTDDNGNDNQPSVDFTNGEIEIVGSLEAIGADSITVSGAVISTAGAEIKGTLVVGETVKVHASSVDGVVTAREVEVVVADDHSNDDDHSDDSAIVIPADCVPAQPAGWTTYTIQPGDSLSAIAIGSMSTLGDVALANCISDPRMIVAGSTIFVPQTPIIVNNGGSDDGSNHDSNDDNGSGSHSSDDGSNHDSNDDKGGDNHGSDNSGHGSDDSGSHDSGDDSKGD